MQLNKNEAFWITGFQASELRPAPEPERSQPGSGQVVVQALYSAISRGTESLVYNQRVPVTEHQRMRAPFQEGDFPGPVKYGYASVGEVLNGPADLQGQRVFCLYPHQRRYSVPAEAVIPLPAAVPPARAILAANMETAVNGVWDAQPAVGDRIAVVGLGVVGLLVAWLVSRIPGVELLAIDPNGQRQAVAERLGFAFSTEPDIADCDLVIHASGQPAGLATALALAGAEARVIELSWYGDQPVQVPLGQAFHPGRLTLKSSQVGQLPVERRPRWDHRRRLALVLELLAAPELDVLISGESRFEALPKVAADILRPGADALCHRIVY
ncbi:dehydrogenase [Marinobacter vinifirmus]|uniref:Dehydrogenase n=1 Tax=Marinobacter vinifirmus TaxID=355591 RepID=A0A7Z1DYM9_9GAMM|nr:zinc-binding alcohol dehydrogenase [Marinobacter vinifirmus]OZC37277.1 dehydrogenase [Marinobacter vinifirmus]